MTPQPTLGELIDAELEQFRSGQSADYDAVRQEWTALEQQPIVARAYALAIVMSRRLGVRVAVIAPVVAQRLARMGDEGGAGGGKLVREAAPAYRCAELEGYATADDAATSVVERARERLTAPLMYPVPSVPARRGPSRTAARRDAA
jgi:hypothetical protein